MKKLIIAFILTLGSLQARPLKLVMFEIFHGDMMYLELPSGENIVIDAGKEDKPKKFLFPYLAKNKIKKIDYLILTHMDYDHIGGAPEIIEKFDLRAVIYNGHERNNSFQRAFIDSARKRKIRVETLQATPLFKNNQISLKVLHPTIETLSNNLSLVFKLQYKNFSILFSGDIEEEGQRLIYSNYKNDLKSTVYKVHHHGDSSYLPYINAIAPLASICPCLSVPFFYPNKETMQELRKYGKVYNVRKHGRLTLLSNGYDFRILTEKK